MFLYLYDGEKIMSELVIGGRFLSFDFLRDFLVKMLSKKEKHLPPKKEETVWFRVAMAQGSVERLEELRRNLGAGTRAEVLEKSLGLLDLFVREQRSGGVFILREKDGEESKVVL